MYDVSTNLFSDCTFDFKLAASMNRAQTQKVALCWASWTPSFKQNTCEVSIQMQGGPVPNPDNTMIFKNYSVDSSNKEISTLSSGKINFVFKIKKEEDSRPASAQSPEPTQSQRQVSVSDAPADQKSSYSSVASLPSPNTMTEQASSPADAQNGRPPLSPIMPTRLPVTSPMVPVTSQPIRPSITHQVMANTGQPLSAIQGPIQQQYQLLAQASPHVANSMDIKHLEVGTAQGAAMDLEELPFTPVHAPIMPRGSYSTRGHGLSRASFAHLYQAGFEDIKDRHGEIAEVIDPTDHINLNPDKENNDPLQCNEIVLQFLALSRVLQFQESTPPSLPRTVFFTFQFYRYPAVTTERYVLNYAICMHTYLFGAIFTFRKIDLRNLKTEDYTLYTMGSEL
jgi:nephrocystin-4